MSNPIPINIPACNVPAKPYLDLGSPPRSPFGSPGRHFQIPSPIITKRTRTFSASEVAASNPQLAGTVKYFCRQKGHGFITPDQGGEDIFFHISDIDGELVPKHGDTVSYRTCLIPPKNEKLQAVHVIITSMVPGTHERWDYLASPTELKED